MQRTLYIFNKICMPMCQNIQTYLRYLKKCTFYVPRILTLYIPKTYVHFFKDMFLCTTLLFRYDDICWDIIRHMFRYLYKVYISLHIFTYLNVPLGWLIPTIRPVTDSQPRNALDSRLQVGALLSGWTSSCDSQGSGALGRGSTSCIQARPAAAGWS